MTISPRLSVWIFVVVVLMAALLYATEKFQLRTSETAYAVAATRMLNKANYYRENWMLNNQPEFMDIHGHRVVFNDKGWPLPVLDGKFNCPYWFEILNENESVFGYQLRNSLSSQVNNGYICAYSYKDQNAILLKVLDNEFTVSIDLSPSGQSLSNSDR